MIWTQCLACPSALKTHTEVGPRWFVEVYEIGDQIGEVQLNGMQPQSPSVRAGSRPLDRVSTRVSSLVARGSGCLLVFNVRLHFL